MAIGRTNAGGGGFNKSVIIVTAPTGSTVTCTKGTTVKTASEKNGEWWFKNLDIGEWSLKATLSGQTATQTVNVTQFGVYRVAMSYFKSTIKVTYPAGSTCTCSKDGEVLTAPNTSGSYTFTVTSAGTWTVKATDGDRTKSETVSITASGETKNVSLSYELVLSESDFNRGWELESKYSTSGGLRKGWTVTNEKIDLTNYSTLTVNFTRDGTSGGKIYVTTNNSNADSIEDGSAASVSNNTSPSVLDVKSINGSFYIAAVVAAGYASSASLTISGIKLS